VIATISGAHQSLPLGCEGIVSIDRCAGIASIFCGATSVARYKNRARLLPILATLLWV